MSTVGHDPAHGDERRVAVVLGAAVLIAIVLLSGVRALTAERAAEARAERLADRLDEVLSVLTFDSVTTVASPSAPESSRADPASGSPSSDERGPWRVHRARLGERTVGAALQIVAPDGYGGPIELLVGVRADGSVTGVRVLSHRETPGLGDRIERRRSDWITAFDGRSLGRHDWRVTRTGAGGTFDALSGATVTSRAVVDAVHRALVDFSAHRERVPGR